MARSCTNTKLPYGGHKVDKNNKPLDSSCRKVASPATDNARFQKPATVHGALTSWVPVEALDDLSLRLDCPLRPSEYLAVNARPVAGCQSARHIAAKSSPGSWMRIVLGPQPMLGSCCASPNSSVASAHQWDSVPLTSCHQPSASGRLDAHNS